MKYTVNLAKEAERELAKLPPHIRESVISSFHEKLETNPHRYGKRLHGKLKGLWSLRIGDYRALYTVDRNTVIVIVIAIGHRKTVYDYAQRHLRYVCEGEDGEDGYWVFDPPPTDNDL